MALPCMKLNDSEDDYSGGEGGQDNFGFANDNTDDDDEDKTSQCVVDFGPSVFSE